MTPTEKWEQYQMRHEVLNHEQSIAFEAVPCAVCGDPCNQLCRCMTCRQFAHIRCMVDGSCAGGCA
jgi:hypothetical protein